MMSKNLKILRGMLDETASRRTCTHVSRFNHKGVETFLLKLGSELLNLIETFPAVLKM